MEKLKQRPLRTLLVWRTAWSVLAAAAILSIVVALVRQPAPDVIASTLFVLPWVALAGLLFWKKPDDPTALAAAFFLVAFPVMFSDLGALAAAGWTAIGAVWEALGSASVLLFLYLFPRGHFYSRLSFLAWLVSASYFAARAFMLGSPVDPFDRLPLVDNVAFILAVLLPIGLQIVRYRRIFTPAERQQTKAVLFGVSVSLAGMLVVVGLEQAGAFGSTAVAESFVNPLLYLLLLLVPASLGVAILRYRLWDVDLLINRALIYGGVSALLLALYVGVVIGTTTFFQGLGWLPVSVAAVALVAFLFQPVHSRLQHWVNRLTYGDRDDPYLVLAGLGRQLQSALAPEAVLPAITATVAEALRLPYVAIELEPTAEAPRATATEGSAGPEKQTWPIEYRGERLGRLVASPRRGESFGSADIRLLSDLAAQTGAASHAVRLSLALQAARERLVLAREEERRRLRRDLHDDLGAALGGLTLKAGAARSLLESEPIVAAEMLDEIEAALKASVQDVRRLVDGLRPPVLDERGLAQAIRDCADQVSGPGRRLRVTVRADSELHALPAAVELAAFRIAQEAMTNAIKHSAGNSCKVDLSVSLDDRQLTLRVSDDGVGLPPAPGRGIGITSMEERAAELGGVCRVEDERGGGVLVTAIFPLHQGVQV